MNIAINVKDVINNTEFLEVMKEWIGSGDRVFLMISNDFLLADTYQLYHLYFCHPSNQTKPIFPLCFFDFLNAFMHRFYGFLFIAPLIDLEISDSQHGRFFFTIGFNFCHI